MSSGNLEKLATLEFPVPQSKLESLFSPDIPPQARNNYEQLNLEAVQCRLRNKVTVTRPEAGLCLQVVRELKKQVEIELEAGARKFYEPSSKWFREVHVYEIAKRLVTANLPRLYTERELKSLLTADVIRSTYLACLPTLGTYTQSTLFGMQMLPRFKPFLDQQLEFVDVTSFKKVGKKALKLLGKLHMDQLCATLSLTFESIAKVAMQGFPMDWDVDPNSAEGQTMLFVCRTAHSLAHHDFQECLQRCLDSSKYVGEGVCYAVCVPAALCRVFLGLVNLRDFALSQRSQLFTHPQVYIWMRALVKQLYSFPLERAHFENRYVSELCSAMGRMLQKWGCLHLVQKNYLETHLLVPLSPHTPDFAGVQERCKFQLLDDHMSINTLIHISGFMSEADDERQNWEQTTCCLVSREAFCWKASSLNQIVESGWQGYLTALSIFLLQNPILKTVVLAASVTSTILGFKSEFEKAQKNGEEAGRYLALLIIHGRLQSRFLSFFSHSLGTSVTLSCLRELGLHNYMHPEQAVFVNDVILMLGAVGYQTVDWQMVTSVVRGRFINIWSRKDRILQWLFSVSNGIAIGLCRVECQGVENFDVTDIFEANLKSYNEHHTSARKLLVKVFKLINYYP